MAKQDKVGVVMREFQAGKLHSGSSKGPKVTSRAQAVAIGLSEARKAGQHVAKKRPGNPMVDVPRLGDYRKYTEEDLRRGYRKGFAGGDSSHSGGYGA